MAGMSPDWLYVAGAESAPNPIALAHFATLRVVPEWTEAVAIVEELCATLLARGAPLLVPQLEDISITAHGDVMVRRTASGSSRMDELGRILHALLDPAATPTPVRLFVAHAIDSGAYSTVDEFARALAYYGRPNRQALIRGLYERVLLTPEPVNSAESEPHHAKLSARTPRGRRPAYWVAGGIAACTVLGLLVVWMWNAGGSASFYDLQASVAAAADAARARIGALSGSAPQRAVDAQESDEPSATSPQSAPRGSLADREIAAVSSPSNEFNVAASAPIGVLLPAAPTVDGALATPPAVAAPDQGQATVERDTTVYAAGDRNVDPPVLLAPKLPPVRLSQPFAAGTNTMELLIDEFGRVEQVKLVSPPVRLSDMTLLSAAKTWRFHPAHKHGQPVRYRLAMSWTVSPP